MRRVQMLAILSLLGFQAESWGHPGHGHVDSSSPLHYLTEPIHQTCGLVLLFAVAGTLIFYLSRRRTAERRI